MLSYQAIRNVVIPVGRITRLSVHIRSVVLICCMLSGTVYCQVSGSQTITSPNPKTNSGYSERDMMRINYHANSGPSDVGGIVASMDSSGGKVEVSVYAFDSSKADGKGQRAYYVYSDETSSGDDFVASSVLVKREAHFLNSDPDSPPLLIDIRTTNIDKMAEDAKVHLSQACLAHSEESSRPKKWIDLREKIVLDDASIPDACVYDYFSQPIILEVKITGGATLTKFKVPKLGVFDAKRFKTLYEDIIPAFRNPQGLGNRMMIAAHRGYFRFRPENSISAMKDAIALGVDMVEADVRVTKDNHLILSHDIDLGRLASIPSHIEGNPDFMKKGRYMIDRMNLCDLRPDLCSRSDEPVRLKNRFGRLEEKMPTFKEALIACRGKVIFDVDKVEDYGLVFKEAEEVSMTNQVVIKGRFGTPQALMQKYSKVPWWRFKFTPIYISDISYKDENNTPISIEDSINSFLTVQDSEFDMPGVELVYRTQQDILLNFWGYRKILLANRHVIQFPQYPEVNPGVWNPKKFMFSDFDPRHDHRADWEWVLKESRRPTLLITDRLELLMELLKKKGLRE